MLHPTTNAVLSMILSKPLTPVKWGGLLGLIQDYDPGLYDALYELDVDTATALFVNDEGRTISWQIATRAAAGDPIAKGLCDALNLLSPNHCQVVLDS